MDRQIGREVVTAKTYATTNGVSFHVVKFDKGFVVTSGDTAIEPVIVHSSCDDLVPDERNPLWVLVCRDLALRACAAGLDSGVQVQRTQASGMTNPSAAEREWSELLAEEDATQSAATNGLVCTATAPLQSIADVRVAPLVKSKWNQSDVISSRNKKHVYNYYTPCNVYCGCVATAGAQIMRYFEWPKTAMEPFTCVCTLEGELATYTSQGGLYDWSNMPLNPTCSSITEEQQKAIGKLTSDLGICMGTVYSAGGSGAPGYMLRYALTRHFGYSNAVAIHRDTSILDDGSLSGGCTAEEMKRVLVPNLEAGLPVAISVADIYQDAETGEECEVGHELIGDGYGYSGETLFYHLNLGWGGTSDAWYAPPVLETAYYEFTVFDGFVYNIYTNESTESVICCGRVFDLAGQPVANVPVEAVRDGVTQKTLTTNDKGSYAFILPEGSYTIKAQQGTLSARRDVTLTNCVSLTYYESGEYFGYYSSEANQVVGNLCDQDLTLAENALTQIEVRGPTIVAPGECVTFRCVATYSDGSTNEVGAAWALCGERATINANGELTVMRNARENVVVMATYAEGDLTMMASQTVMVVSRPQSTPLPEVDPSAADADAQIQKIVEGNESLASNITDVAAYVDFRDWVREKGVDEDTALASSDSFVSFALDQSGIVDGTLLDSKRLEVKGVSLEDGCVTLTVAIEGLPVGEKAKARYLEKVFVVTGSVRPDGTFSSENATYRQNMRRKADGSVSCSAEAKPTSYFYKVHIAR